MSNEGWVWAVSLAFVLLALWRAGATVGRLMDSLDKRDAAIQSMARRAFDSAVNTAEERQRIAAKSDSDFAEIRVRELRDRDAGRVRDLHTPAKPGEDQGVTVALGEDTIG